MIEQNNVPLMAIILEPIVAIVTFYVGYLTLRKYTSRRNQATLFLALSILSLALAVVSSAAGKNIQFFTSELSEGRSWVDFTIAIAYCFTALSNVFAIRFLVIIFKNNVSNFPLFFGLFNGITLGYIVPRIAFTEDLYSDLTTILYFHILVTFVTYSMLIYYSFREARQTQEVIPKNGFRFIGAWGIFVNMVFIFFILDLVVGDIVGSGYTPFYYAGWVSGGLAAVFGYLGYIMPDFLKNWLTRN